MYRTILMPLEVLYQIVALVVAEHIDTMVHRVNPQNYLLDPIVALLTASRHLKEVARKVISDAIGLEKSQGGR